jgi:hypothetical protein
MRKFHILTAIAAVALAGAAFADQTQRGAPGANVDAGANVKLPMIDKNSDGKVTRSEAASNQQLSQQFDSLDSNKDGALSQAEFAKFEAKGEAKGSGAPAKESESGQTTDKPATTDDSTPSSSDKQAPSR